MLNKILTFHCLIDIFRHMTNNHILKCSDGELINVTTFGFDNNKSQNCIILVHGFKGFKDWGYGPYAARYFAQKGFFVLTFNFSHNGIGDRLTEFDELDKFAENTFSREIRELSEIVDAYKNNVFGKHSGKKVGLVGHSRGGAIAVLTAKQKEEIGAIAMWASVATLDRYSIRQKEQWRKKGVFEVLNARTKQVMKLNLSLLDDIEKNSDDILNIEKAVKKLNRPLLIAHGSNDLAVPKKEADLLYEWSNKSITEFFLLEGTGHTFDIQHPFIGSNEKFEKLLDKTSFFFKNNLS